MVNMAPRGTYKFLEDSVTSLAFSKGGRDTEDNRVCLYLAVGGCPRIAVYEAYSPSPQTAQPGEELPVLVKETPMFVFDGHKRL